MFDQRPACHSLETHDCCIARTTDVLPVMSSKHQTESSSASNAATARRRRIRHPWTRSAINGLQWSPAWTTAVAGRGGSPEEGARADPYPGSPDFSPCSSHSPSCSVQSALHRPWSAQRLTIVERLPLPGSLSRHRSNRRRPLCTWRIRIIRAHSSGARRISTTILPRGRTAPRSKSSVRTRQMAASHGSTFRTLRGTRAGSRASMWLRDRPRNGPQLSSSPRTGL